MVHGVYHRSNFSFVLILFGGTAFPINIWGNGVPLRLVRFGEGAVRYVM